MKSCVFVSAMCALATSLYAESSSLPAKDFRDSCVEKTTVVGEAPSLLPQGRAFKLVWNDEFNGTQLNTSK